MKINKKSQNGAISLFVLVSMLFFLTFMLGVFTILSSRNSFQLETLKETQKIYSSKPSAEQQYDSLLASANDSFIPVTNLEQLKTIKTVCENNTKVNYLLNGKVYTFKEGANFVLQNDIIVDLEDMVNDEKNLQNILCDYVLYNDSYSVNMNGYNIFYKMDDGSYWKLLCYQNIGTNVNPNLFSANENQNNYYGRSYSSNLFSVIDDEMNNYSSKWFSNDNDVQNFEFLQMYTVPYNENFSKNVYGRWRQTNNPVEEIKADDNSLTGDQVLKAEGYTINFTGGRKLMDSDTDNYWGGLARCRTIKTGQSDVNVTRAYLDGSVGSNYWLYAVGVCEWFPTYGIPVVPNYNGINASSATESLFFVRCNYEDREVKKPGVVFKNIDDSFLAINKENVGEYLGREVEYTPSGSATGYNLSSKYRIFYIDFDNKYGDGANTIYLKADCSSNNYNLLISTETANSKYLQLNNKWNLSQDTGISTTNNKAIVWLLKTSIWENLKDTILGNKINYVVGSPTIDMFVDSYNLYLKSHSELKDSGNENIAKQLVCLYSTTDYSPKGYKIGLKNGETTDWYNNGYTLDSNKLVSSDVCNGMYNPGNTYSYWIASPSANNENMIMRINGNNTYSCVDYDNYSLTNATFCPIVSIKPNAILKLK